MNEDIYDFIQNKQEELIQNKAFNEWNKDNKIKDENGDPVIVFHGSTQKMFTEIDEKFFDSNSYVYGGFYTSNNIDDVNDNYAKVGKDLDKTATILSEQIRDFYEFQVMIENGVFPDDSFSEEELEIIEELYEEDELTVAMFKEKLPNFSFSHIEEMMSQFDHEKLDWNDGEEFMSPENLSLSLLLEKKYKTQGWVAPLVIKMTNPCYTGFGEKDTMISFSLMDSTEAKEYEEEQMESYPAYEEAIEAIKDIYREEGLNPTDFMNHFEFHASEYQGFGNISSMYESAVAVLTDDYDYDYDDARKICANAFEENASDYISFDEDFDVENDEELYIPDYSIINGEYLKESVLIGEKIMESLERHHPRIESVREALSEHADTEMNIEDILRVALVEAAYEDEEREAIFKAISSVFDGIVMNAYKANKENWGQAFDLDYDTKHYIVFEPKNIKSAIGNTNFSLYNNDFVQRKTSEEIKKAEVSKNKSVIKKHLEYINSTWSDMPNCELVNKERFDNGNVDAVYSRKENKIYINESRMDNIEKLEKTLFHETVVHYGLHKFFEKEVSPMLEKVSKKYAAQIEEMRVRDYSHLDSEKDKLKLAEEFVAFEAEKILPEDTFLKKARKVLKKAYCKFKKAIGFKMDLEDDLFEMLTKSENLVKGKKKKNNKQRKNKF